MSLQLEDDVQLPDNESDVAPSDDEDEDYSWVYQYDEFLSKEETNTPMPSNCPALNFLPLLTLLFLVTDRDNYKDVYIFLSQDAITLICLLSCYM